MIALCWVGRRIGCGLREKDMQIVKHHRRKLSEVVQKLVHGKGTHPLRSTL